MTLRTGIAAGLAAVVLAATGCGGDGAPTAAGSGAADPTAPVVLRAATLRPGQPLPAATGSTLCTLTGALSAGAGGTVALDRRLLDQLSQVQMRVYEPWVKRDLTFRGVWLADVLAVAGATVHTRLRITAQDDYTIDLGAADLRAGDVMLATADGAGREIPIADGGPTRIVFRNGTRAGQNADQWIWSLRTIDVQ